MAAAAVACAAVAVAVARWQLRRGGDRSEGCGGTGSEAGACCGGGGRTTSTAVGTGSSPDAVLSLALPQRLGEEVTVWLSSQGFSGASFGDQMAQSLPSASLTTSGSSVVPAASAGPDQFSSDASGPPSSSRLPPIGSGSILPPLGPPPGSGLGVVRVDANALGADDRQRRLSTCCMWRPGSRAVRHLRAAVSLRCTPLLWCAELNVMSLGGDFETHATIPLRPALAQEDMAAAAKPGASSA